MAKRKDSTDTVTATILSPRPRGNEPVELKRQFVMTLRLTGARATGARFTLADTSGKPVDAVVAARLLSVHGLAATRPAGGRGAAGPRWTYLLEIEAKEGGELPAGTYELQATPTYSTGTFPVTRGDAIDVRLAARVATRRGGAPVVDTSTVDYPKPDHQIDVAEQVFFYATGQATNPVWSATIVKGEMTRYANYVMWVPELTYWVAEFLFLGDDPGPGEYEFQLQATPDPGPVPVVIL